MVTVIRFSAIGITNCQKSIDGNSLIDWKIFNIVNILNSNAHKNCILLFPVTMETCGESSNKL